VRDWDVLALDEPTNHLDVEAITWLAGHLRERAGREGALLLVTHDRWFLDEVATATWEVHDGIVEPFEGGYAAYVLQRLERDRLAATAEAKRQNLMRKELAWLRRGPPARTSKPQFRIDAANALIADVPPLRNRVELSQMATTRLGKDVVDLLDVGVTFGDREILRDVEHRLAPGERLGIVGANGSGKSTLLSLIAGTLTPSTGRVKRGKTVRIGTLDQQAAELTSLAGDRVREVLARYRTTYVVDGKELTPAQLLERLGFRADLLSARVGELSGGQRRRLQLLLVLLDEPNVLLLDEPTNDVDTDTLAAMEDLLDTWPGTLVVVSHDRYLLERVTDDQYAVLGGRLRHLPGGVEEYLRLRSQAPAVPSTSAATGTAVTSPVSSSLSGAELRTARKEIAAAERRLARLADDVAAVHDAMASHDPSDHAGLTDLAARLRGLEDETGDVEERWLELSERVG
jgi:ABC transport system ATP-binding/permease protein